MKEQVKYVLQHWNCFSIQCSETCPYVFNSLVSKCYRGDFAYLRGAVSTTTIPYTDIQLYTSWWICEKSVMFIEVQYFLKMNLIESIVEKNTCLCVSFYHFGVMTVAERSKIRLTASVLMLLNLCSFFSTFYRCMKIWLLNWAWSSLIVTHFVLQ